MSIFIHPPSTIDSTGLATEAKQDTIISHVDGVETKLDSLIAKDFATSAKQDTLIGHVDQVETKLDSLIAASAGATSMAPLFWDFSAGGQNLVANTWKEIIASTATKAQSFSFWNPTGEILEVGFGAAASEVAVEFIGPGDGIKRITIPAGTRVSLRCANNLAADTLVLGFVN